MRLLPSSARVLLCAALLSSATVAAAAEEKKSLEPLSFLVGCWQGELGGGVVVRENHSTPFGGQMLGMSQTVAGGKTIAFEYLRITEDPDGKVSYRPSPGGQGTVTFQLVKATATEAVFENPAHDFPQRIAYELKEGQLVARIELLDGKKRQEFPMRSVSCTGSK